MIFCGSRVYGDPRTDSDFDVQVLRETGPPTRLIKPVAGIRLDVWVVTYGEIASRIETRTETAVCEMYSKGACINDPLGRVKVLQAAARQPWNAGPLTIAASNVAEILIGIEAYLRRVKWHLDRDDLGTANVLFAQIVTNAYDLLCDRRQVWAYGKPDRLLAHALKIDRSIGTLLAAVANPQLDSACRVSNARQAVRALSGDYGYTAIPDELIYTTSTDF